MRRGTLGLRRLTTARSFAPVIPVNASLEKAMCEWRHDFHRHPELAFEEKRTTNLVAERLESFGLDEVARNVGRTGVVGTLRGTGKGNEKYPPSTRIVALRADMDALQMQEEGKPSHASTVPGKFHGCGHDGHTTMLLGAAKLLADTKSQWSGTVRFVFQPAEEALGGAAAMVADGLFTRFPCDEIYGLHNWPGWPENVVDVHPGPRMASSDNFDVVITALGGHAAMPHLTPDVVVAASNMVTSLQTVVSRLSNPVEPVVVSVTKMHAGSSAYNVLPSKATLAGTMRCFDVEGRKRIKSQITQLINNVAETYNVKAKVEWEPVGYPPTVNDPEAAFKALQAAKLTVGEEGVSTNAKATMGAEDFSEMLLVKKGAYIFLGAGETWKPLHHPEYDFNDRILVTGATLLKNVALHSLENREDEEDEDDE